MFYVFSILFFCFSMFFLFFFLFFMKDYSFILESSLIFTSNMDLSLMFCFDYLSVGYFFVVSMISSMVFFYSGFYMNIFNDLNFLNKRFILIFFLFVVSMFFLVFSFSWFSVMLGWDGLGVVSFILVVYFNKASSLDSGFVTIFSNRIGDCFFILSFMFMFYSGYFSFSFLTMNSCKMFLFFLVLGIFTKSAQFPFSAWLPEAMAAPTPVSSLVHSSTLVTAGVYLLLRYNFLFLPVDFFISLLSLITMLLGGFVACYESDFKKIVAMSTLSQLGMMIFTFSLGFFDYCFIHMVFHAFFKSSLFLSTGNLMHNLSGDQDSRLFGNFYYDFFSKFYFFLTTLNLMGFPFLIGFFSKDNILSFGVNNFFSLFFCFFMLGCVLTVCYSLRILNNSIIFSFNSNTLSSSMEIFLFIFPVFFLSMMCIFSSFFFINNFLVMFSYTFLESTLGLIILLLGVFFYTNMPMKKIIIYYLSNMFFLKFNSTNYLKFQGKGSPMLQDLSWTFLFSVYYINWLYYLMVYFFNNFFKMSLFYIFPLFLLFCFI